MSIGERIRHRRDSLGLTQQELGRLLGVTPQHISAIEENKRMPSVNFLAKLSEKLGLSIDYLVTGKGGEGGFTLDPIVAIKADKNMTARAKRALISFIEEIRRV